jgi:hypothetical protein
MSRDWTAIKSHPVLPTAPEIAAMAEAVRKIGREEPMHAGAGAIIGVQALSGNLDLTAPQPAPAQEAKGPAAPASSNPMDFFAKKKDGETDKKDEDDEDGKGKSSGSGSKGVAPKSDEVQTVPKERFDSMEAVEQKAKGGMTMMPEGLSDAVKAILKSAADTLSAGLFGTPELQPGAQGSGGDSRTVKPGNAPTSGTPFKR